LEARWARADNSVHRNGGYQAWPQNKKIKDDGCIIAGFVPLRLPVPCRAGYGEENG
jgi:hypothetical protein